MKHPFKLNGDNFYISQTNYSEIVDNYNGKYLLINLEKSATKKELYFEEGEYIMENVSAYQDAFIEFGDKVIKKLESVKEDYSYQIFIKE